MLQALDWFARRGRGHCDIKGPNIRIDVSDDGEIRGLKVIDFGCSIRYQGEYRIHSLIMCNKSAHSATDGHS